MQTLPPPAATPPMHPSQEGLTDAPETCGWRRVTRAQITPVVEAIADEALADSRLECAVRTLPFYGPETRLVRLRKAGSRGPYRFYLSWRDRAFHLNGTSPPLHEANAMADLRLNRSNALQYLWFFCFFVRGEHGPFYVLTDISDPMIPTALLEDATAPLADLIKPPVLEGVDDKGGFRCLTRIIYADTLFTANMLVRPGGMIDMFDDAPLITDLAATINAPLS